MATVNVKVKCFACDRLLEGERLVKGRWVPVALKVEWVLVVGEATTVPVGRECFSKVKRADGLAYARKNDDFYQPPKGGPRLCLIGSGD
jgi:hypothetical protein